MSNKNKYRELCEQEPSIPIFSQAWWLDTVAQDDWDVVLVEKGDEIYASLPFCARKKYGLTILTQPVLTQHLGPWLRPGNAKYARRLAQEKDLLQSLYSQLPKHIYYSQNWHHQCANWLPLHWMGYEQATRYTYRIDGLNELDKVKENFDTNIRTDIRKAKNKVGLKVVSDLSIDDFLELNRKVFSRQNMTLPYSEELVKRIHQSATTQNASKCFVAIDKQGRRHAGVYIIWDNNSAYYLLGGGDPELRNSGATSLCMWEAIQFSATVTKSFDFEGSMIEPIERFFRAFGAVQTPYFTIRKSTSRLLDCYHFLRTLKK